MRPGLRPDLGGADPCSEGQPHYLRGPGAFIWRYLRGRPLHFLGLFLMVLGAASCSIGVQYVTKMLVDAMAGPGDAIAVWTVLAFYLGLIASESLLGRLTGWLGCRTTVGIGVDVRLDLFAYLNGQPMRYFAENLAGALGQRVTATAGFFGALINTVVWRVLPPCVDFLGALLIFSTVDWRMVLSLGAFVILITAGLVAFGERGRTPPPGDSQNPRQHRQYVVGEGILCPRAGKAALGCGL
jgi:ATP-binding cassette subfamily B protein